jgi:S1-C subfamily serine protease
MIVLAGNGHLTYGSGIPKRTARRNGLSYAIVLNDAELEKDIADYVVFPKHIEGKKPVRMMVLLDENKGRVTITGFPENSISKKAGLEEGDTIMFIDDIPISSIDDVKIYLLEKHNEEKIRIRILRGYGGAAKDMQFEITL